MKKPIFIIVVNFIVLVTTTRNPDFYSRTPEDTISKNNPNTTFNQSNSSSNQVNQDSFAYNDEIHFQPSESSQTTSKNMQRTSSLQSSISFEPETKSVDNQSSFSEVNFSHPKPLIREDQFENTELQSIQHALAHAEKNYKQYLMQRYEINDLEFTQVIILMFVFAQCDPNSVIPSLEKTMKTQIKEYEFLTPLQNVQNKEYEFVHLLERIKNEQKIVFDALASSHQDIEKKNYKFFYFGYYVRRIKKNDIDPTKIGKQFGLFISLMEQIFDKYPESRAILDIQPYGNGSSIAYLTIIEIDKWLRYIVRQIYPEVKLN